MQPDLFALHIVLPLHMLQQGSRHQVFKAQAFVTFDQTGVVKIDFGRLQRSAGYVVVPRAHHKHDVQGLQNV